MGSFDRSKKKTQLWKNALIHFSLCFLMGFFSGFVPTGLSARPTALALQPIRKLGLLSDPALAATGKPDSAQLPAGAPTPPEFPADSDENPRRLLIMVTAAAAGRTSLTSLAHTLRLVRPPLLWVVVGASSDAPETARELRATGIMYRHLTYRENFTEAGAEAHHQRNVALGHLEHHRLAGIVHFAGLANVYDLRFFEELRQIEVFGTWPVAAVSANSRRVAVEGPVCGGLSKVAGWFSRDLSDGSTASANAGGTGSRRRPEIGISGFGFNSSILWDPERWGRPASMPDTSQDSMRFVQEVMWEDESKLKCIPSPNSQIMLWQLHTPRPLDPPIFTQHHKKR